MTKLTFKAEVVGFPDWFDRSVKGIETSKMVGRDLEREGDRSVGEITAYEETDGTFFVTCTVSDDTAKGRAIIEEVEAGKPYKIVWTN